MSWRGSSTEEFYEEEEQLPQQHQPQEQMQPPQEHPPDQMQQTPPYAESAQGYQEPPPDPQAASEKAWKKLNKKFKGGMKHGIFGGVKAGIMYILIPFLPLIILSFVAPPDFNFKEAPDFIRNIFDRLGTVPIYMGWFMVITGFSRGYFRRGSFERVVSEVIYSAGKALFVYALLHPFILTVDEGMISFNLDYVNYFKIIYVLIVLQAFYAIAEYIVLRKDLKAFLKGDIPMEYYPKKYRESQGNAQ